MLIAGWGKDAKKLCAAGLQSCGNCNNMAVFQVYKVKKRISLYFVPVAKWDAKYFAVCPVCEAAAELTAEQKDTILRESVALPSEESILAIWNRLDAFLGTNAAEISRSGDLASGVQPVIAELTAEFPRQDVDYVVANFIENLKNSLSKE